MTLYRTKAAKRIMRSISDLSNVLRLFLALWEHWNSHILV